MNITTHQIREALTKIEIKIKSLMVYSTRFEYPNKLNLRFPQHNQSKPKYIVENVTRKEMLNILGQLDISMKNMTISEALIFLKSLEK